MSTEIQIDEEWRVIPSFPNYQASSNGRVRRQVSVYGKPPGTVLKPSIQTGTGYPKLTLIDPDGRRVDVHVHRAVCEAFHGPCGEGKQCAHNDGTRTNNVPSNLRWATPQDNQIDRRLHGTAIEGQQVKNSKLTPDAVREIRIRRGRGERYADIAARFSVTPDAIGKVCQGINWRHVT